MSSESKTAQVRQQIQHHLKKHEGEWMQQKEIIDALLPNNPYDAKIGVYFGIFTKHAGTSGISIRIPNVEMKKEGRHAFYRYVKPAPIPYSKDSQLHLLAEKLLAFEQELHESELFNVDMRTLSREDMAIYLDFVDGFMDLKHTFLKEQEGNQGI